MPNPVPKMILPDKTVHLQQHLQETKKSLKKQRARTQPGRYRQSPLPNSPLSFRAQRIRMHIPKVGEKKLKTNTGPKRNLSMLAPKNPTKKSSPKKYVKAPAPAKKKKKLTRKLLKVLL